MMRNETDSILDDLLSRWHSWARGWAGVAAPAASANFRDARTSRQYESADDVVDGELNACTMKAIDFQVSEMKDPHRTAIHFNARNLATGAYVWSSPRLPADPIERSIIVMEARNDLMRRLMAAGIA